MFDPSCITPSLQRQEEDRKRKEAENEEEKRAQEEEARKRLQEEEDARKRLQEEEEARKQQTHSEGSRPERLYRALYSYSAEREDELSFTEGTIVKVLHVARSYTAIG